MSIMQQIKRDFTRHRHKAAVLGVLVLIMAVMSVRAVFQLQPQQAAAMNAEVATADSPTVPGNEGAEAEERIRLSKELWKRLRERRGAEVRDTFRFESTFYMLDPSRPIPLVPTAEASEPAPALPREDPEAIKRAQFLKQQEQLQDVKVQSTTTGPGKPWAIVSGRLLSVGDTYKGFEITAIRGREVDFTKDGTTIVRRMPDEPRGQ